MNQFLETHREIESIINIFQYRKHQAQVSLQVSAIKHLKKNHADFLQSSRGWEHREHSLSHSMKPVSPHGHRCKNPQQNISKWNPIMY